MADAFSVLNLRFVISIYATRLPLTACWCLQFLPHPHVPRAQIAVMPAQRLGQQMRRVFAVGQALSPVQVIEQQLLVVGIRALLDDEVRALARRQAAQVGQSVFADQHLHVVLGVVHVRNHRHNR